MAQTYLQLLLQGIAAYNRQHPSRPIDPQAEIAVAKQEGLSGGIGDGGHAFGPNQLNNAGGVLTGKFGGETPEQINEWAWSPQGIDYALAGVANVAGGLKGKQAVSNIVARFERPANVPRELANALAAYGGQNVAAAYPAGGTPAAASSPPSAQLPPRSSVATQLAAPPQAPVAPPVDYRSQLLGALGDANGNYSSFYQLLAKALQARRAV